MSTALYASRLYWFGMRGVAKHDGCEQRLRAPPHLPGLRISGIDYIPEIRLAMVMPYAERWRDMAPEERRAAHALLVDLSRGPLSS